MEFKCHVEFTTKTILHDIIVCRGAPGSGKSTYIKELLPNYEDHTTDNYFMKNGKYSFNIVLLAGNHILNQLDVLLSLKQGKRVVIGNTHGKQWELKPYFVMANMFGLSLQVITFENLYGNVHGVPETVVMGIQQSIIESPIRSVEEVLSSSYPEFARKKIESLVFSTDEEFLCNIQNESSENKELLKEQRNLINQKIEVLGLGKDIVREFILP